MAFSSGGSGVRGAGACSVSSGHGSGDYPFVVHFTTPPASNDEKPPPPQPSKEVSNALPPPPPSAATSVEASYVGGVPSAAGALAAEEEGLRVGGILVASLTEVQEGLLQL